MAQAKYQTITTATSGSDGLCLPDWQQTPFSLSYAVEVPAGVTTSFTVQYTLDDVNDPTWTPVWIADPTNGTAKTGTVAGFYGPGTSGPGPIRGLRVNVSSLTGGVASLRFAVLQGSTIP